MPKLAESGSVTVTVGVQRGQIQIRRDNRDNFGDNFNISHKNIFCDPSLEPSLRDGSNEGSQHMFLWRDKKNCL